MERPAPPIDTGPEAVAAENEQPWLRLDKRMLLIHPVNEAVRLLPVLVVSLVVGSQSGNHVWSLGFVGVLVVFAVLRWFTTSYRIGPVHVQLRTGVFQKKLLSVPRTRIRSVDIEANVLHRVLGLSIVRIGTGQHAGKRGDRFELNALDTDLVGPLRETLMHGTHTSGPVDPAPTAFEPDVDLARFRLDWVRYAPLSATGLALIAAVVGLGFQSGLGRTIFESSIVADGADAVRSLGVAVAVVIGLVVLLVAASVVACVRYLIVYGNLTVVDDGRTLRVGHGLLRTRHTTLDRDRLRGASLEEPLLLRLAGGAKLDAVMTGVSADEKESSLLLPSAPAADAVRVMTAVLAEAGAADAAVVPLTSHGPVALRRRFTRALLPVAALGVVLLVVQVITGILPVLTWVALVVVAGLATALAWDRFRGLGHHAGNGWLITRHGSLDRSRDAVEKDGIVGWTVRQSFFQRRAGVATVVANTAAGVGHYEVLDVPVDHAWAIVEAASPGGGDIWVRRGPR